MVKMRHLKPADGLMNHFRLVHVFPVTRKLGFPDAHDTHVAGFFFYTP
jgi:hypothetical protein